MTEKIFTKRAVAAFLLAPFPALLCLSIFMLFISGMPAITDIIGWLILVLWIFIIGLPAIYIIELIFGIPIFYILKKSEIEGIWITMLIAAFLAGGIYFALEWSPNLDGYSSGDSGGALIINGEYTLHGYIDLIKSTLFIAVLGAISGFTFWKIYKGSHV